MKGSNPSYDATSVYSTICVGSRPSVQQGIEISFDVDEEIPIDYMETRVRHISHDGVGAGDAVYV